MKNGFCVGKFILFVLNIDAANYSMQNAATFHKSYKSGTIRGVFCLQNHKFYVSTYYRAAYRLFQGIAREKNQRK